MSSFRHDPDADLDYAFDWSGWLEAGETISSETVTVTSGTATLGTPSEVSGVVTVFVSGAAAGTVRLTCEIVTSEGRTDNRTITLSVGDR